MTSSRTIPLVGAALAAGLILTSGCTASSSAQLFTGQLRLVSFDSCAEAETELRAAAVNALQLWDLPGAPVAELEAAAESAPAQALRAAPDAADSSSTDHSGTNVHETGADEPDLVKTDGRRIVTVTGGVLRVVDAQRQVQTGVLPLRERQGLHEIWPGWQPADLLLHGDHGLVLLDGGGAPMPMPEPALAPEPAGGAAPAEPATVGGGPVPTEPELLPVAGPRLLLVDLTGQPRVLSEYTIDGRLVDGRAVGATARIVVHSTPRFVHPMSDSAGAAELSTVEQQQAAHQAAVAEADISAWLPRYALTTAGTTSTGQVDCTAVSRPAEFSGTSMLTVLTFDLASSALGDGDPVSVVADGETVYSDGDSLYIASDQRWQIQSVDPDSPVSDRSEWTEQTEIHKFDLPEAAPPRYTGSGVVPGWLINQYALSHWGDHLRVATTTGQAWGAEADSESAVYVLAEQDGSLVEVGSVGGLGRTERIYAVRFVGPVGYVVTFRETDPLYTLDLRDPTAPAVRGELKITGYSAYLHPIADGRLIGVGQEADPQGRVLGTQVSLFDVSDLTAPDRLAAHHVANAHSQAEVDPHAFLWWPDDRLLVIPLTRFASVGPPEARTREIRSPEAQALLLRVDGDAIHEVGTISHPLTGDRQWAGTIQRSLVIGDTLWTLSEQGLQANALSTLEDVAWIPFA